MKEQVAQIVSAYVKRNPVGSEQLPGLIASVNQVLSKLGVQATVVAPPLVPAVSIRKSVSPDRITCLDCGYKGQMLKRHLTTRHRLTPEQYRERWKLATDYPLVAPNYASRRSELAKQIGLGTRRR